MIRTHDDSLVGKRKSRDLVLEEVLSRDPPFSDYVSTMTPLPSLNAVGNAGFTDPEFIPSVPWLVSLNCATVDEPLIHLLGMVKGRQLTMDLFMVSNALGCHLLNSVDVYSMDLLATKAHIHDDPRQKEVAATYARRAKRFVALLNSGYRVLFLYTLRLG